MDARAKTVKEILSSGSDQYLVPFFQRHYKWRQQQWGRLWDDILHLMDRDARERHFLGSLVCTPLEHAPGSSVTKYQMIDGQQRVTTLAILLTALRNRAKANEMEQLGEQLTESFLIHRWNSGLDRYRVLPRTGDREALCQLIDDKLEEKYHRSAIASAYRYFERTIEEYLNESESAEQQLKKLLIAATDRLSLVVITIDDENPYEIFWSLNGKGLPLEQSDLIRNYIFMQVPPEEQDSFNREHWHELEELLGETGKRKAARGATRFYRNYVLRKGDYSRKDETFADFKRQHKDADRSPVEATRELKQFARYYVQLQHPNEVEDAELSRLLFQILKLNMSTAFPLLMRLMAMHDADQLSRDDLLACITYLASFVLRRSICSESTRPYSLWFVDAIEALGDNPRENLKKFLLDKQWPDDAAFISKLADFEIYRRERKKAELILEELERRPQNKELVELTKLTIEHVMPQNLGMGSNGKTWRAVLGDDWQGSHKKLVHTLGNLTLTGYNSELSNASFEKKKAEYFKSHVQLNAYFADRAEWTPACIRERSELLGKEAAQLWPRPDGKPYVPTKQVVEEHKKLCLDYWNEFAVHVKQSDSGFEISAYRQRPWMSFRAERPGFWYVAEFVDDDDSLYVGVVKRGKEKKEYIEALWNDLPDEECEAMDTKLSATVDFQEYPDYSEIHVWKEFQIWDRADWQRQHEWLILALQEFSKWLAPYIDEVDPSYYEDNEEGEGVDDEVTSLAADEDELAEELEA